MLLSAAFAGPAGPAFSFSAFPSFFHQSLPRLIQRRFSHPLGLPLSRICSQLAHTAPTGPVWDCAGAFPLPGSQNRTQALTGPSLVSLPLSPSLSR